MNLVECKHLSKNYGSYEALQDICLTLKKGKIYGLLGPNGSGKSTLIKLINDLLTPTKGEILIQGKHPGVESKKIISYLPERTYLDPSMRVEEAVDFFHDFYEDFEVERAYELMSKVGIDKRAKLKTLSKGMKEKVQLILVMSRKADLYILDEPIGGVDPAARDYILDTILTNFHEDSSILISTHLIADIERILDEVIFLSKGKIVLSASADELRTEEGKSIDQIFREVFKC